jgi:hypothetical protein
MTLNFLLRRLEARVDGDSKEPFFSWLLNVSKDVYPMDRGYGHGYYPEVVSPNFEELIHTVERLSYLFCEHYYDSIYKRPPPFEAPFFRRSKLGRLLEQNKPMSFYDIVIRASNFILDTVSRIAAQNPRVEARDVIDRLADRSVVKLFSLNYDSRLIDRAGGWWTGFRALDAVEARARDTKVGVEVFEPSEGIPIDRQAFVQVHGSTHFTWIAHYKAPKYVIARRSEPLDRHGTPRRGGFELWNDRSALPVLSMVTGFRKGEKVLAEPYASYTNYLRQEAFRSPYWAILGYGGNDPNINSVLTTASDFWGDRLRAYIFSYMSDDTPREGQALVKELRRRVGFLGKNGLRWNLNDIAVDHAELTLNPQVRISTDGDYAGHIDSLCSFLGYRDNGGSPVAAV